MPLDVIRLLPDSIANQIAAGEVVQRPASAVKELLENSLDAGATQIQLVVKDAGKSMIRVVDNGEGMSVTDARMCFERHATSKINSFDDLQHLRTKGFRGEALASIAAVAQVTLRTQRATEELGTEIHIEATEVKRQEPVAMPQGTCIEVCNLFFNVPARRNFLKSNPVEFRHITDEFHRVALAHPDVAFSLVHNDLDVYRLDAGKLSKRIIQLFGKNYQEQLIVCQEETPYIQLAGYVGKPAFAKKTRGEQFFFVNGRFIRNPYLNHAVQMSYEGLLKEGSFSFYVLNIMLNPATVDVNVHPTKTEVKFMDERILYGIIHSAVKQSLAAFSVTPSLDFSTDINFLPLTSRREEWMSKKEGTYGLYSSIKTTDRQMEQLNKLYQQASREDQQARHQAISEDASILGSRFDQATKKDGPAASYRLHDNYLVRQVKTGMMVMDKEAALTRIYYEQLKNAPSVHSQSCLFPQQVQLNGSDYSLVIELKPEIQALGFEFEVADQNKIMIQGVPSDLAPCNEVEIFEGILEQYKQEVATLRVPQQEGMQRAMAARMANNQCRQMDEWETDQLIERLFGCDQPNFSPAGQPTYVLISLEDIKSWFNK